LLKKTEVTLSGETQTFEFTADSGNSVYFYSCPVCSSTLYWQIPVYAEHWAVAVGGFADSDFPAPTFSVYEDRKHCWLQLPETITEHLA